MQNYILKNFLDIIVDKSLQIREIINVEPHEFLRGKKIRQGSQLLSIIEERLLLEKITQAIENNLWEIDYDYNYHDNISKLYVQIGKLQEDTYQLQFSSPFFDQNIINNEILSIILNYISENILIINSYGQIQYCNDTFIITSKYSKLSILGRSIYPLFVQSHNWKLYTHLPIIDELRTLDGYNIPVQIKIFPVKGRSWTHEYYLIIFKNLEDNSVFATDVKISEKLLESISYASEQFLFSNNWSSTVSRVIEYLGKAIFANQISLFKNSVDEKENIQMTLLFNWKNPLDDNYAQMPRILSIFDENLEMFNELSKGNIIYNKSGDGNVVKTMVWIPVFKKEIYWGALRIDESKNTKLWNHEEIKALKQIANIIGASIHHEETLCEINLLREKAEESNRLKSAFLSNIGHELRTPLNAIIGFSELLKKDNLEKEKQNEFLTYILDNSKQLLKTIDILINYAKIESDNYVLSKQSISVKQLLTEVSYFAQTSIVKSNKTLKLLVNTPINNVYIISDKQLLLMLFEQLISNAVKFTHYGTLEIGFLKHNDVNRFYVSDTGVGIAKEKINSIFNKFYFLENETTRQNDGMGIGLSLVKSIVEKLKGKITVHSEINMGTTVIVDLQNLEQDEYNKDELNFEYLNDDNVNKQIYLYEKNNILYTQLLSILKMRYNNIVRVNTLDEINPYNAQLVILNIHELDNKTIKKLEELRNINPHIQFIGNAIQSPANKMNHHLISVVSGYSSILPTVKMLLK